MKLVFLVGGLASGKSSAAHILEGLGAYRIDLDQLSREVCAPGSALLAKLAERFGQDLLDQKTGELKRGLLAQRAFCDEQSREDLEALEIPAIKEALLDRIRELKELERKHFPSAQGSKTAAVAEACKKNAFNQKLAPQTSSLAALPAQTSTPAPPPAQSLTQIPTQAQAHTPPKPYTPPSQEIIALVEIPLLDRALDLLSYADEVVAILLDRELRLKRAVERGLSRKEAQARLAAQPSDAFLKAHADTLIYNDGGIEELQDKLVSWWKGFACSGEEREEYGLS